MQNRIRFILLFSIFGFLLILGKLSYWQIFKRKDLLALASGQYHFSQRIIPERGRILSSDGFPLVMNKDIYQLSADPSLLNIEPAQLLEQLNKYIDKEKINRDLLRNKKLYWVLLKDNLNNEDKNEIEKMGIKGINFEARSIRFYPEASMSAQLLGFVGKNKEGEIGYFGLEGYYDKELKGKEGQYLFEKDALGRPLSIGGLEEEKLVEGRELTLNIDRRLQFLTEKRLEEGIEKYQAISGSALILNPENGAVLAMSSLPQYEPASYYNFDQNSFRNPNISSVFEPGSIFKVLVMAAALDAKAVNPDEKCSICYGPKQIGEYSIKTWNEKYYPNSTMSEVIIHSDNVGMVYVVQKIGQKRFLDYIEKFGLGRETGIDLQGEIAASLKENGQWREIDLATASFGQGIALTPIQILSAVSSIANKGRLYQPQVVKSLSDNDRKVVVEPKLLGETISPAAAKQITEMMVKAVESGEAKWAKPKGYKIAGKTGTAQIPIAGHYDPEKTITSFIGFAPANDPKFAMLVTLREPKTSLWGSETAAPLWFKIAGDIFRLWKISPEADF